MYLSAVRSTSRVVGAARHSAIRAVPRRLASTTPRVKARSWKGTAVRWTLALGALYWYNTSPVFAEETLPRTISPPSHFSDAETTTIDAIIEEKRKRAIVRAEEAKRTPAAGAVSTKASEKETEDGKDDDVAPAADSPEALGVEADQQGAFNPETGEINWDCPCLGGMANGPCGEEFKAAFSCFVYSTEEPKGMDCIEKFQGMQTCFRRYPEIYGAELEDDDEEAPEDSRPVLDGNADAAVPPSDLDDKEGTRTDASGQPPRDDKEGTRADVSGQPPRDDKEGTRVDASGQPPRAEVKNQSG